jgi:hypothetical protein
MRALGGHRLVCTETRANSRKTAVTDSRNEGEARPPADLDTSVAHPARVYDYWLGGKDNFAADREAAEQAIAANPTIVPGVRTNRAFLRRAVSYLASEAGIRQFLDVGTGLPSANNTHQVAQAMAPDSKVVYVDNDHSKPGCVHPYERGSRGPGSTVEGCGDACLA